MSTVASASRWSIVGLPVFALVAVGTSIVAPLTAVVAGPTLLVASAVVFRQAQASRLRGIALVTGTVGAALSVLVVVVGLFLVRS